MEQTIDVLNPNGQAGAPEDIGLEFDERQDAVLWVRMRQRLFLKCGYDGQHLAWWATGRLLDDNVYRWTIV